MINDLVSVIIPTYNCNKYIERSIYSVINQTYNNLEIIVIDDGSTDNTKEIVEKIAQQDNRVNYIYKENGGVGSARNVGLDVAIGKYIAFLDADDEFFDNYIFNCIDYMNNYDTDLIISQFKIIDKNNIIKENTQIQEIMYGKVSDENFIFSICKELNIYTVCNKFFIKDRIEKLRFNNNIEYDECDAFVLEYLGKIKNLLVTPKYCSNYYINFRDNSIVKSSLNNSFNISVPITKKKLELAKQLFPNSKCLWYEFSRMIVSSIIRQGTYYFNQNFSEDDIKKELYKMLNNELVQEVNSYMLPHNSYFILLKQTIKDKNVNNLYNIIISEENLFNKKTINI